MSCILFTADKFSKYRYYLPFAESAIRYFYSLGFVPWRLRKLSSGDVVPEVIPLGIFTWTIESITNRNYKRSRAAQYKNSVQQGGVRKIDPKILGSAPEQLSAEAAFKNQMAFFAGNAQDKSTAKNASSKRPHNTQSAKTPDGKKPKKAAARHTSGSIGNAEAGENDSSNDDEDGSSVATKIKRKKGTGAASSFTPAYFRQKAALERQHPPPDDEESKILRYCIEFTENCSMIVEDVEIYEYISPTNSVTRNSVLHGTVPSPLSHILMDYQNIRTTQIRQSYADSYNTQAKLICSYNASKNMYNISEGNPILNSEGWAPQQRLGLNTDTNMPSELEANAYTRDSVTESLVGSKQVEHKPVVYSLPKNTTLEGQQKLESIVDVGRLQVCVVSHNCFYYTSKPECIIPGDNVCVHFTSHFLLTFSLLGFSSGLS
jgi:hypothetical protein